MVEGTKLCKTSKLVWMHAAVLLLIAGLTGCGSGKPPGEEASTYVKEIKTWQKEREERLREPTSWLSLAGLYWLEQGRNTFGSDSSNAVVFPRGKAPKVAGVFVLSGDSLSAVIEPGVDILHDGEPVKSIRMYNDQDPGHEPTVLEWGSLSWYAIERSGRIGIRLKDSENERLKAFKGIETYPIDPRWRIEGRLEPYDPPRTIAIIDVLGNELHEPSPGALVFDVDGRTYRLDPIAEPHDESLFLVFGDATNGRGTYGAGRFLVVDAPAEDGKVVIDFNKAYNPPCAFTPYATCPLPPQENYLSIAVTAGEKTYGHGSH